MLAAVLAGFLLYLLLSSDPGGDPPETGTTQAVASTDYAELVSLFGDFRSFEQAGSGNIQSYSQSGWILSNLDAAPDFSAAAMAEKYGELRTFQERLESIDPTGWTIP
ncbi:MAG: hypothetical protein F4230_02175, partial [Holophagales bacterium]|nr:hypothetical protein [Holophagales bacterium]